MIASSSDDSGYELLNPEIGSSTSSPAESSFVLVSREGPRVAASGLVDARNPKVMAWLLSQHPNATKLAQLTFEELCQLMFKINPTIYGLNEASIVSHEIQLLHERTALLEDTWIKEQVQSASVSQLQDTAIAVDASYYLQLFLDNPPYHEPLLPALGGLTGIESHIENDLDNWKQNETTPFFIFNGQSVVGQDEVSVQRGKKAIQKTDEAWELYFDGKSPQAVNAFSPNPGAYPIQNLYPLLQTILKKRNLHFLVPPYNASAQLAHFNISESEQCSAIMGPQELLLYPIQDYVITFIDWDMGNFRAISKKGIVQKLNVSEPMFVDALMMTGNTFLPTFPPLQDKSITTRQPFTVMDAVNMLRTAEKSVATACASFSDILSHTDPNWQNKYRKARMTIDHFIYVSESGEIKVHNLDTLTYDNYEYLGYQLPAELFHYLNTGLISARTPSWISHGQIIIPPTLDGVQSEEYKKLVTTQLMPMREQVLGLLLPRLHRGIQFKPIYVKAWYDDTYSHTIEYRTGGNRAIEQAHTWNVKESTIKQFFPNAQHGSILFEVDALKNLDFAQATITKEKGKGIDSADLISSVAIWRFLHLRGYVDQNHQLTVWGEALATSLEAFSSTVTAHPNDSLAEAVILAFELLRFDLLNTRNQHPELNGLPLNGSDDDKASLLLISRTAILLKLHHEANGYTGPLSKNFLCFRSLSSSIRQANRDLVEAIVASMLLFAESKKEREDYLDLGQRLPFLMDTDVALGIAVKTLLDDIQPTDTPEQKQAVRDAFPGQFVPYATDFFKDLKVAFAFFDALHAGVKILGAEQVSTNDRKTWDRASEYLAARR